MSAIQKFAGEEARSLIKLHTSVLYQWAEKSAGATPPQLKEALLATCARLYELLEDLKEPEGKTMLAGKIKSTP